MASRRRGWLWLLVGLVFALLAAFIAMAVVELRVQQSVTAAEPEAQRQATAVALAPVVVAVSQVSTTKAITETDVALQEWPAEIIPEGAATKVEDVVGKIAMADIFPGEAVMTIRLADPDVKTEDIAFTMDPDMVVFALPPDDLMSNINLLRPGDLIDILFTLKPEQEVKATPGAETAGGQPEALGDPMFTTDVIQGQRITAIVVQAPTTAQQATEAAATPVPAPRALLLAMAPQDALILKYFQDAGGTMDIVLRYRGNETIFDVEAVNYDYVKDKYSLPAEELLPVQ